MSNSFSTVPVGLESKNKPLTIYTSILFIYLSATQSEVLRFFLYYHFKVKPKWLQVEFSLRNYNLKF